MLFLLVLIWVLQMSDPVATQSQVQAEFWHDPLQEARYRASSKYLAHLNNERVRMFE